MLGDPIVLVAVSVVCGLAIGVLSGLLGIGGGTLMIPLFRLLFGMSPTVCTATCMFAIIPTSLSGAAQHMRNKTCLLPVALAAGAGGAVTSPVGVWLAQRSPGWLVMLTAALIIGYTAINMLRKAIKVPRSRKRSFVRSATLKQLVMTAAVGMVAGVASGFVGVGGGFLMVPLFLSVLGLSMHQASGTSLAAVMVLAAPGVATQMMLGNVNYFAGIAIVCGTIPGALIGARLAKRVPDRALRFTFGIFLLVGACMLALNEIGLMA